MKTTFTEFFEKLTGNKPFSWQERMAAALARGDRIELQLPTATGKTTGAPLAWLWALASQAEQPKDRTVPLRLIYVAPRRALVDDVYKAGRRFAAALSGAEDGPLLEVADALKSYSRLPERYSQHPQDALAVANLRGGRVPDLDWRGRCDVPTLVASTEEQAMSGLLFRSYISRPRTAAMIAGMLGIDSCWLIDESHLMMPSVEAVERCSAMQGGTGFGMPPLVIRATATPEGGGPDGCTTIELDDEDLENPVLERRVGAPKLIQCVPLERGKTPLQTLVRTALTTLKSAPVLRLLIVVNKVDNARAIHRELAEKLGNKADLVLLHGQQRELERQEAMGRLGPLRVGAEPLEKRHLVVVSTSVIEVGMDLDSDVMISETAPWPNLQQRFGRCGRDGKEAPCKVVASLSPSQDDSPFNDAARKTFKALRRVMGRRKHIKWLITDNAPDGTVSAPQPKPWPLNTEAIERLAITCPVGAVTVGPEQVMSGVTPAEEPDVSLVWRDMLDDNPSLDDVQSIIKAHPMRPHEIVTVPISQARRGLRKAAQATSNKIWARPRGANKPTVYKGDDTVTPGCTVLLPSSAGGYGLYGIDWDVRKPVTDVSDVTADEATGRGGERWHRRLNDEEQEQLGEAIDDNGATLAEAVAGLPGWEGTQGDTANIVLLGRWVYWGTGWDQERDSAASCSRPKGIPLDDHQGNVADLVDVIAGKFDIPPKEARSMVAGGAHHDEGKRITGIQAGYGAKNGTVLAKSRFSQARYNDAITRAGLTGWRHEAMSALLLSTTGDLLAAHLAAATHGWGRPAFRTLGIKDEVIEVKCNECGDMSSKGLGDVHGPPGSLPGNFVALNKRYGPWGLAWMEAVVRQADWMASAVPLSVPMPPHKPLPANGAAVGRQPVGHRPVRIESGPPFDYDWTVAGLLGAYGTLVIYDAEVGGCDCLCGPGRCLEHPGVTLRFVDRHPVYSGPFGLDDFTRLVDESKRAMITGLEQAGPLFQWGAVPISELELPEPLSQEPPLVRRLVELILSEVVIEGKGVKKNGGTKDSEGKKKGNEAKLRINQLALPISVAAGARRGLSSQLSPNAPPWGWDAEPRARADVSEQRAEWHWLAFVGALLVPYKNRSGTLAVWGDDRDLAAVMATLATGEAIATPVPIQRTLRGDDRYFAWHLV